MKIIDSHFHIYKSEQAGRSSVGPESPTGRWGTLDNAIEILDRGTIDRLIAVAVIPILGMRQTAMKKWPQDLEPLKMRDMINDLDSTLLDRLSRYNDWICKTAREDGRIEPVIAADPTINGNYMVAEIIAKHDRYRLKALKIHPAVNRLSPSYQGYRHIFELAEERNLVVISHGGWFSNDPEGKYCAPKNFKNLLDKHMKLKLVVAHLAYPYTDELLNLASKYQNLYTDLSFALSMYPLTDEELVQIIRSFGPERVLFGSDFPWSDPEKDFERVKNLGLTDDEVEMIFYRNAMELFRLE